jgi:hypothetical protein
MLRSKLNYAAVILVIAIATSAEAQKTDRIRNALSGPGASVCADSPLLGKWCADLGVQRAYWIDRGVSLAIDRHFEQKDQAFANNTGITIATATIVAYTHNDRARGRNSDSGRASAWNPAGDALPAIVARVLQQSAIGDYDCRDSLPPILGFSGVVGFVSPY